MSRNVGNAVKMIYHIGKIGFKN